MRGEPDENGHLTSLLQALPAPEPSAEFLIGARRRYHAAIDIRDRRHVVLGLVAALIGLTVVVAVLGSAIEPAAFVAWLAEATADLARWTTGIGVVVALVPLSIWTAAVLSSAAAVLSLVLIARARSLAPVK
jgi:hypothetical protein